MSNSGPNSKYSQNDKLLNSSSQQSHSSLRAGALFRIQEKYHLIVSLDSIEANTNNMNNVFCNITLQNQTVNFLVSKKEDYYISFDNLDSHLEIEVSEVDIQKNESSKDGSENLSCSSTKIKVPKNLENSYDVKIKKKVILPLENDSGDSQVTLNFAQRWVNVQYNKQIWFFNKAIVTLIEMCNEGSVYNVTENLSKSEQKSKEQQTRDTSARQLRFDSPTRTPERNRSRSPGSLLPSPKTIERNKNERFLEERLNPILEKMMVDIILEKPKMVCPYISNWMQKWGTKLEKKILRDISYYNDSKYKLTSPKINKSTKSEAYDDHNTKENIFGPIETKNVTPAEEQKNINFIAPKEKIAFKDDFDYIKQDTNQFDNQDKPKLSKSLTAEMNINNSEINDMNEYLKQDTFQNENQDKPNLSKSLAVEININNSDLNEEGRKLFDQISIGSQENLRISNLEEISMDDLKNLKEKLIGEIENIQKESKDVIIRQQGTPYEEALKKQLTFGDSVNIQMDPALFGNSGLKPEDMQNLDVELIENDIQIVPIKPTYVESGSGSVVLNNGLKGSNSQVSKNDTIFDSFAPENGTKQQSKDKGVTSNLEENPFIIEEKDSSKSNEEIKEQPQANFKNDMSPKEEETAKQAESKNSGQLKEEVLKLTTENQDLKNSYENYKKDNLIVQSTLKSPNNEQKSCYDNMDPELKAELEKLKAENKLLKDSGCVDGPKNDRILIEYLSNKCSELLLEKRNGYSPERSQNTDYNKTLGYSPERNPLKQDTIQNQEKNFTIENMNPNKNNIKQEIESSPVVDDYQKIILKSLHSLNSKDLSKDEKVQDKIYRDIGELVLKLMDDKIQPSPMSQATEVKTGIASKDEIDCFVGKSNTSLVKPPSMFRESINVLEENSNQNLTSNINIVSLKNLHSDIDKSRDMTSNCLIEGVTNPELSQNENVDQNLFQRKNESSVNENLQKTNENPVEVDSSYPGMDQDLYQLAAHILNQKHTENPQIKTEETSPQIEQYKAFSKTADKEISYKEWVLTHVGQMLNNKYEALLKTIEPSPETKKFELRNMDEVKSLAPCTENNDFVSKHSRSMTVYNEQKRGDIMRSPDTDIMLKSNVSPDRTVKQDKLLNDLQKQQKEQERIFNDIKELEVQGETGIQKSESVSKKSYNSGNFKKLQGSLLELKDEHERIYNEATSQVQENTDPEEKKQDMGGSQGLLNNLKENITYPSIDELKQIQKPLLVESQAKPNTDNDLANIFGNELKVQPNIASDSNINLSYKSKLSEDDYNSYKVETQKNTNLIDINEFTIKTYSKKGSNKMIKQNEKKNEVKDQIEDLLTQKEILMNLVNNLAKESENLKELANKSLENSDKKKLDFEDQNIAEPKNKTEIEAKNVQEPNNQVIIAENFFEEPESENTSEKFEEVFYQEPVKEKDYHSPCIPCPEEEPFSPVKFSMMRKHLESDEINLSKLERKAIQVKISSQITNMEQAFIEESPPKPDQMKYAHELQLHEQMAQHMKNIGKKRKAGAPKKPAKKKPEKLNISIGNLSEVNSYGLRPVTEQDIAKEAGSMYTYNNFNNFKMLGTAEIIHSDEEFDRDHIEQSNLVESMPVEGTTMKKKGAYKGFDKQESRITNDCAQSFQNKEGNKYSDRISENSYGEEVSDRSGDCEEQDEYNVLCIKPIGLISDSSSIFTSATEIESPLKSQHSNIFMDSMFVDKQKITEPSKFKKSETQQIQHIEKDDEEKSEFEFERKQKSLEDQGYVGVQDNYLPESEASDDEDSQEVLMQEQKSNENLEKLPIVTKSNRMINPKYQRRNASIAIKVTPTQINEFKPTTYSKADIDVKTIRSALSKIPFINELDKELLNQIPALFETNKFNKGNCIVKKGETLNFMFIVDQGKVIAGQKVIQDGEFFAENSLLQSINSQNDCQVDSETSTIFKLNNQIFNCFVKKFYIEKRNNYTNKLKEVLIIGGLTNQERVKLSDKIIEIKYKSGDEVFKQNDIGNEFYIIKKGSCIAIQKIDNESDKIVKVYKKGEYFGESALISNFKRRATVIAQEYLELFVVERSTFNKFFGAFTEFMPMKYSLRHIEEILNLL